MGFKKIVGITCFLFAGICLSDANIDAKLIGTYSADDGRSIQLIFDDELQKIALSSGHVTQGASIVHNNDAFCYITGNFDIIVPRVLKFGSYVECLGGSAELIGRDSRFEEEFGLAGPVYIIRIIRNKFIEFQGELNKRVQGYSNFKLYYSKEVGLIALEFDQNGKREIFVKEIE